MTVESRGNLIYFGGQAMLIDDTTTPNITYVCKADPGTLTSVSRWQIFIVDETTSVTNVKWADGNSLYDNKADDRATLSYS